MATSSQVYSHHNYTIGWVCALSKEQTAAIAMLDAIHDDLPNPPSDPNAYTLGSIGKHNIVIACLPEGRYGNNAAATAAAHLVSAFPSVRFGLLVGIGGGNPCNEVRLGDVVVSKPTSSSRGDGFPGVIQWDYGKYEQDKTITRTGALNNPPTALLTALSKLKSNQDLSGSQIRAHLDSMETKYEKLSKKYTQLGSLRDIIFPDNSLHVETPATNNSSKLSKSRTQPGLPSSTLFSGDQLPSVHPAPNKSPNSYRDLTPPTDEEGAQSIDTETEEDEEEEVEDCKFCNKTDMRKRKPRKKTRTHYGLIASGNMVIKNTQFRNELDKAFDEKILCFEMEAAGLMNDFPCLVIRGICDYADAHKYKAWKEYAASVAAAFAKALLLVVPANAVEQMDPITSMLSDIKQYMEQARAHTHKKEDEEILKWLSPFDYGAEHSDVLKRWQPGTGQWLFESVEFKAFMEPNNKQILFCPGMPGAGKTVMAATVIDYLHKHLGILGNASNIAISYVYFNFNRNNEQTPHAVFLSLLRQIARQQPTLPVSVRFLHEMHAKMNTRPSWEDILKTFQEVVKLFSKVFVVIDAVDECATTDHCREIIVSELIACTRNFELKLFTTSRNIPEISDRFESTLRLEIRATESDIRRYIDSRLPKLLPSPDTDESNNFQKEVKAVICRAASGIFLLAQLHLDQLTDCISKKDVTRTLQGFRTGSDAYDNAYEAAMKRINRQTPRRIKLAISVLSWITHARRPLSIAELQHALGVEVGEADFDEDNVPLVEKIVSTAVGLVVIDDESDVIRLVHYTTQEFFERTKSKWLPNAENYVAEVCTSYLSCSAFKSGWCHNLEDLKGRIHSFKFYPYTVRNWNHHVNASDFSSSHAAFLAKTLNFHAFIQAIQFLDVKPRWNFLRKTYQFPADKTVQDRLTKAVNPSGITGLHVAAESGWTEIVKRLLKDYDNIDIYDHSNRTPFFLAAKSGHLTVMETLLSPGGIDVNVMAKPSGYTPLICLARRGHLEAVTLLLRTGKINLNSKCSRKKDALWYAAVGGHDDVVKLLMDAQNSDADMVHETYSSALLGAVIMGKGNIVNMLLKEGHADINIRTTDRHGPYSWDDRTDNEYLNTVIWKRPYNEMKLKAFPKPKELVGPREYVESYFGTATPSRRGKKLSGPYDPRGLNQRKSPLILAVQLGHESLVKFFLDKKETDVELEASDSHSSTALSAAARGGHVDICRLLLNSGRFNVNSRDNNGDTPLMIAALEGHKEIVELLLKTATVGIDGRNEDGRTALLLAISRFEESTSIVELLLDTGIAGVNEKDQRGCAPLHMAVRRGHKKIVRLLFDTPGIDFDLEDMHGRNPLSLAIYRRQKSIVKLCLDSGRFDINAKDHFGLTPLMLATKHFSSRSTMSRLSSRSAIFRLLLDTGNIDFNAKDHKYQRTALLWAAHAGNLENFRALLQMGKFDLNESDLRGLTCFTLAAQKGRTDVVEYLLNKEGVDLYAKDHANQRTALMWASYAHKFKVVELLLKSGRFNINDVDSDGLTPNAIASQQKNHMTVGISKEYNDKQNEKDQNQTDERSPVTTELRSRYEIESDTWSESKNTSDGDTSNGDTYYDTTTEYDTCYTSSDEDYSSSESYNASDDYSARGNYNALEDDSVTEDNSVTEDYSASEDYSGSGTDES